MLKIPGDVGYRTVDQICASNRTFLNQLKFRDTSCQDNLQIRLDQCNVVFCALRMELMHDKHQVLWRKLLLRVALALCFPKYL